MEVHNFVTDRPLRIVALGSGQSDASGKEFHMGVRLGTPIDNVFDADLARRFGLEKASNATGQEEVLKLAEVGA